MEDADIWALLVELYAAGQLNDARERERSKKMLNLDRKPMLWQAVTSCPVKAQQRTSRKCDFTFYVDTFRKLVSFRASSKLSSAHHHDFLL